MSHPDDTPAAGPWALLWIGGLAAATWLSLVLADQFAPTPPRSAGFTSQPPTSPPLAHQLPADPRPWPASAPRSPGAATRPQGQSSAQVPLGSPSLPSLSAAIPDAQVVTTQARAWSPPRALSPSPRSAATESSQPRRAASGAMLLGGALDLQSLQEKAMVPAARAEQALRQLATDRLQALPLHWRRDMRALLRDQEQVVSPAVVRLPAPHLSRPEEIPLAVRPGGLADTTVQPASPRSLKALEQWVERQQHSLRDNQVRPVVVVLEPISPADTSAAKVAQPVTDLQPSLDTRSKAMAAAEALIPIGP